MSSANLVAIESDPGPEQQAEGVSESSWPRTRLASAVATGALVAALSVPVVAAKPRGLLVLSALVPVLLASFATRWSFDSQALRRGGWVTFRVLIATLPATVVGCVIVVAVCLVLGLKPPAWSVVASAVLTALVVSAAAAARAVEVRLRRASRRVFLVATPDQRWDLAREARRHGEIEIVGFAPVLAVTDDVTAERAIHQIVASGATSLVLAAEASRSPHICAVAARVNVMGCRVRDLTRFYEQHFHKVPVSDLTPSWFLFDIAEIHRPRLYGALKRGFEVFVAVTGLLVFSPGFAAIAIAVRLSGAGPILFRQERMGLHGEPFTMLKFRTMAVRTGPAAAEWAGADAARVTAPGRFLRRFRLDEVPQLLNVLSGQLSLIGPRPEQVALVRGLEEQIPFYAARHTVRPGLTGWAQVNFGYGGSVAGTLEKIQYDFFYIKHQSLRLDLLVLAGTFRTMILGKGI